MKRGIFIGRTTMDIVYYRHNIPAENKKSKTKDYTTCVGGNACNAAITYTLLGGKATLITAIGNSSVGKSLKMELEQHKIEVIDLIENQEILPYISAILINVENESRTIWGGQPLYPENITVDVEGLIKKALFFMADNQFPELIEELFQRAKQEGISSVFDAERWGPETDALLGAATDVIASVECVPTEKRDLFEFLRGKNVLYRAVTNGGNPIIWEEGNRKGAISPIKVKPVDTLGAGDILHGAYCYFRFDKRQSFEKALENASRVSSYSVACRGPRDGVLEYITQNCQ